METTYNRSAAPKKGNELKLKATLILLSCLCFSGGTGAFAAGEVNAKMPLGDLLSYWIFASAGVIFLGLVVYVLRNAFVIMHDNGRPFELSFPVFSKMAHNGKAVGVFMLVVVLIAVIWALNYVA